MRNNLKQFERFLLKTGTEALVKLDAAQVLGTDADCLLRQEIAERYGNERAERRHFPRFGDWRRKVLEGTWRL